MRGPARGILAGLLVSGGFWSFVAAVVYAPKVVGVIMSVAFALFITAVFFTMGYTFFGPEREGD